MKFSAIPVISLLLVAPLSASAEWYWLTIPEDPTIGEFTELSAVEYAVTQIPKDQLQAVEDSLFEASDLAEYSDSCASKYSLSAITDELRKYDAEHDFYTVTEKVVQGDIKQGYTYIETSTTTNQSTIDGRESLISSITTKANSCLEQEEAERKKKERVEDITLALENCDTDFFENEMTNDERMETWNERQECVTNQISENEVVTPPVVATPPKSEPEVQEAVAPVVEPVSELVPSVVQEATSIEPEDNKTESVDLTPSTAPTSTETKIDDLEADFVEQVVSNAETIEPESEPSFFGRVANFFRNLFSW